MVDGIINDSKQRMQKVIELLKLEMNKLRTGRAHASLLEHIMVDYYGVPTPLSQVANVNVEDARTLAISPWDKGMVQKIEKAIQISELGLNPATTGTLIRVPLPPPTEARRKEMTKVVRNEGENARVSVRNIRRDANNRVKELLKSKDITEDDEKRAEERIQKMTDEFIKEVDHLVALKEKDLMEV